MSRNNTDMLVIENQIVQLQEQRMKLVSDKKEKDYNCKLNTEIKGDILPNEKYKGLRKKRDLIKDDLFKLDAAIFQLSQEIRKKSVLKEAMRQEYKVADVGSIYKKIEGIRNYYMEFASDKTRVASMRAMAAEMAAKLQSIL